MSWTSRAMRTRSSSTRRAATSSRVRSASSARCSVARTESRWAHTANPPSAEAAMSTRFCTYAQNHSAAEVPPYVAAASPKALATQAMAISTREHSTTIVNRATIGPKTASVEPWKVFCSPTNTTNVNTKTSQGDFLRATRGNVVSASAMKDEIAGTTASIPSMRRKVSSGRMRLAETMSCTAPKAKATIATATSIAQSRGVISLLCMSTPSMPPLCANPARRAIRHTGYPSKTRVEREGERSSPPSWWSTERVMRYHL